MIDQSSHLMKIEDNVELTNITEVAVKNCVEGGARGMALPEIMWKLSKTIAAHTLNEMVNYFQGK